MALYDLKQQDINDTLRLIASPSLTITADNAARVAHLQSVLRSAQPSTLLEECKARCDKLEHEVQACLSARDAAQLEAGMAKKRADEAEALLSNTKQRASDALAQQS
jgi:outer membrane murein-binding lipoprotein Lpp